MTLFRWLLRKKQLKGHGIHSPFAFDIVANVISSPYSYYAFNDIVEVTSGLNSFMPTSPGLTSSGSTSPGFKISRTYNDHNKISFRLVNYFNAKEILEINSGKGIGSLFLLSPASDIRCTFIEEDEENILFARELQRCLEHKRESIVRTESRAVFVPSVVEVTGEKYDAIFLNLNRPESSLPSIEKLFELSNKNSFWVIHPINNRWSKHFWHLIVNDKRVDVTFDFKNRTGIAFFRDAYHKQHYFV